MNGSPLPVNAILVLDDAVLASIQNHGFGQLLENAALAAAITGIARRLGLTTTELNAELRDGRSLAELAAARGIGREELVGMLTNALFLAQAHHPGRLPREILEEHARFVADHRRRERSRNRPHRDDRSPTGSSGEEQPAPTRLVRVAPPDPHVLDTLA